MRDISIFLLIEILYRNFCEKFCNCSRFNKITCKLFNGCKCKDFCAFNCICFKEKRECDPKVCKSCNCDQKGNCRNSNIFYKTIKLTAIAKSTVCDSFGLFALESIKLGEFICEYVGDLVTREESDRRTVFLNHLGSNYLFKYGANSDIDAYRTGNEMR